MEELFGVQQQVLPASSSASSDSAAVRSSRKNTRTSSATASTQTCSRRLQVQDTESAAKQPDSPDSSVSAAPRAAKNLTPEQVHELEDLLAEFLAP